jgi:hypothetical protein
MGDNSGTMTRYLAGACLLLVLLSGCSEPRSEGLGGTWVCCTSELDPGYQELELEFTATGRFRSELRSYGAPGQARDDLSTFNRIEGTVRRENDCLFFAPERRITWNYGGTEIVEEPYSGLPVYEDARYRLEDDRLTLQYTDYYPGIPMGVTLNFNRAPTE